MSTNWNQIWVIGAGVHEYGVSRRTVTNPNIPMMVKVGEQNTLTIKVGSGISQLGLDGWRIKITLYLVSRNQTVVKELNETTTQTSYSWTPTKDSDYVSVQTIEITGTGNINYTTKRSITDLLELLCSSESGEEFNIRLDGVAIHNYVIGDYEKTATLIGKTGEYSEIEYARLTVMLAEYLPMKVEWSKISGSSVTEFQYQKNSNWYDGVLLTITFLDENENVLGTQEIEITSDEGSVDYFNMPENTKYIRYKMSFKPKYATSVQLKITTYFKLTP